MIVTRTLRNLKVRAVFDNLGKAILSTMGDNRIQAPFKPGHCCKPESDHNIERLVMVECAWVLWMIATLTGRPFAALFTPRRAPVCVRR
jgi:hypothetical protein